MSNEPVIEKSRVKKFCSVCYSGQSFYPTAILTLHDPLTKSYICNCCGTVYSVDSKSAKDILPGEPNLKGDLKVAINNEEISKYQNMVRRRLDGYNSNLDERVIKPIIVPLMWSFYQISHNGLQPYNKTVITTDVPFFLSFGLHNLAMAIGCIVHQGLFEVGNIHANIAQKMRSEGRSGLFKMIYLTDVFDDKRVNHISPVDLSVICIHDNREVKDMSDPKVYSIMKI